MKDCGLEDGQQFHYPSLSSRVTAPSLKALSLDSHPPNSEFLFKVQFDNPMTQDAYYLKVTALGHIFNISEWFGPSLSFKDENIILHSDTHAHLGENNLFSWTSFAQFTNLEDKVDFQGVGNDRMLDQVKKSWLDVQLCKEGNQDCDASNNTTVGGVLKFPNHSNEETFIEVFSSFKHVKVIQFSSVQDGFTGFSDKVRPTLPFSI
ncbi:hypothetical protein RIF29_35684 [Crotalaria pallida]|uniref:Uncharacterized protein n=1 Tax=Crotalaria pallida TaxID=3830 RepID=A0AAN9ECS3_CROPI